MSARAVLLVLLVTAWHARPAAACAACACGDPTLTTMGAEQPFAGRKRLSAELRHRSDGFDDGFARTDIDEVRLELGGSWAPRWWLQLALQVPLLSRDVDTRLSHDRTRALGDIDVSSKLTVWRDREWAPRQLIALQSGIRLPTAPVLETESGRTLYAEAQPGNGSLDAMLGVAYARFFDPWSLYGSVAGRAPLYYGRDDLRVGASARGTLALQFQPEFEWAARLGLNGRLDRAAEVNQLRDPNTGGFVLFVSPALAVTPRMDLLLEFAVHIPLVNALDGIHDEGPVLSMSAIYDL